MHVGSAQIKIVIMIVCRSVRVAVMMVRIAFEKERADKIYGETEGSDPDGFVKMNR